MCTVRILSLLWILGWNLGGAGSSCNANDFEVHETPETIEIHCKGQLVVCYNKLSPSAPDGIDKIYERTGFLHPVRSPAGKTVTASFPFDHPHQQGIFSAWVKADYNGRTIDFWNLKKGVGRVAHRRVIELLSSGEETGFVVELVHRSETEPRIDILSERWRVTAVPTDGSFHCFDMETTQQALTDVPLMIEKFHYGGVAVRGPVEWLKETDSDAVSQSNGSIPADGGASKVSFLNSLGANRKKGNHQRPNWVTMGGKLAGTPVSITVLCDEKSFRAPQVTRLHPTKPYFCFCPCEEGRFQIDKLNPYQAKYRFLIRDAAPDPDWINQRWREFAHVETDHRPGSEP